MTAMHSAMLAILRVGHEALSDNVPIMELAYTVDGPILLYEISTSKALLKKVGGSKCRQRFGAHIHTRQNAPELTLPLSYYHQNRGRVPSLRLRKAVREKGGSHLHNAVSRDLRVIRSNVRI